MTGFRLAHFSDVHVTVPPLSEKWGGLLGKRAAGLANYYVGGRRSAFSAVERRIARLLDDIDASGVDHVLCTGDLTLMSYDAEFERIAALYGERLHQPERHTVIPGNHDRYTAGAAERRAFERWFEEVSAPRGQWPFRKDLSPEVTLVAVDVCRPTSLWDSSGWCGPEQRKRLADLLASPDLESRTVIVALHYALFLEDGRPDRATHGIRDWAELVAVLEGPRARVDLVLHGHVHDAYLVEREGMWIACAGSATDLRHAGGYHIYELDADGRLSIERRTWDARAQAYRSDAKPRVIRP